METSEGNGTPSPHQLAGTGGGENDVVLKGAWDQQQREKGQEIKEGEQYPGGAKGQWKSKSLEHTGDVLDED